MDRGLYSAASGGLLSSTRLDIVANNLANVTTVGYKAQRLSSRQQTFADTLASQLPETATAKGDFDRTPGVIVDGTTTDFSPGPVEFTGNPLHVALTAPNQFFVVNTPQGTMYTRAGNFTRNADGNLTLPDGSLVSGDGGPITLPPGDASISGNGTITVNGLIVGRLQVVEIENTSQLTRHEGVRFTLNGGAASAVPANVVPNSLEQANVGTLGAMVDLINANKAFEAYTKSAKSIDDMNDRAARSARMSG